MQTAFDSAAFVRSVLAFIRRHGLLRPGNRVAVAVSGGADSVALLRLMLSLRSELGVVLSVAHFNHKIRGESSDSDECFVRELAQAHDLELHFASGNTPIHAKSNKLSLETAARDLRYSFFRELIASGTVSKLMTAHTLDDQAETVLMRIIRGTGTAGLAGIYPRVKIQSEDESGRVSGEIIRPLLETRRCQIEEYLRSLGQTWQEDVTNQDVHHARNRVRHVLLPLLEKEFNPTVRNRLAELADIALVEEEHWATQLRGIGAWENPQSLDIELLRNLPIALQRRLIRSLGDELSIELDFETVDAIQSFAQGDARILDLPDGWRIVREIARRPSGGKSSMSLRFERLGDQLTTTDYTYSFKWPGRIDIPEINSTLVLRMCQSTPESAPGGNAQSRYNLSYLLDPQRLFPELTIRNWRAGDRFWPADTSEPKKVKELLQRQHVTGNQRTLWPVLLSGNDIIWIRGFPVSENYRAAESSTGVKIEEVAVASGN